MPVGISVGFRLTCFYSLCCLKKKEKNKKQIRDWKEVLNTDLLKTFWTFFFAKTMIAAGLHIYSIVYYNEYDTITSFSSGSHHHPQALLQDDGDLRGSWCCLPLLSPCLPLQFPCGSGLNKTNNTLPYFFSFHPLTSCISRLKAKLTKFKWNLFGVSDTDILCTYMLFFLRSNLHPREFACVCVCVCKHHGNLPYA